MSNQPTVDIFCTVEASTEDAILIDDGDTQAWIPRSQIQDQDGEEEDGHITIYIPEWLATAEGLV